MKKRGFYDDEEKKVITAYKGGEFRPARDQKSGEADRNPGSQVLHAEGCAYLPTTSPNPRD